MVCYCLIELVSRHSYSLSLFLRFFDDADDLYSPFHSGTCVSFSHQWDLSMDREKGNGSSRHSFLSVSLYFHTHMCTETHTHTCMHAHTQLYTVTWKLTRKHILINSMWKIIFNSSKETLCCLFSIQLYYRSTCYLNLNTLQLLLLYFFIIICTAF